MTSFEIIKYHGQEYPINFPSRIEELAVHFDITNVGSKQARFLQMEYSYGKRNINSILIANDLEILPSQKDGVHQLRKNEI